MRGASIEKLERELTEKVQAKLESDPSITSLLIADATATIKKYFDGSVPEGIKIKVVPEIPETREKDILYLVIDLPRGELPGELSEHELNLVAGGGQSVDTIPGEFFEYSERSP
jgi:hypothetical protein